MKIFLISDSTYKRREYDLEGIFHSRGWEVLIVGAGDIDIVASSTKDIIVVDADEIIGASGDDVVSALRKAGCQNYIMHVSSKDLWSDKIGAIDAGADDYLPKPYLPNEILARLDVAYSRAI